MAKSRTMWSSFALMIIFGSLEFMRATKSPRFEMLHAIDIVELMASGMCIGVAMATLGMIIKGSRKPESQDAK
jgi:hypothetical protein